MTIRQTRYRRLGHPTQLPATTRQHQQKPHHTHNCNTTTKIQCCSVHSRQQQHHDEDPVLFVDSDIQLRGIRIWVTCDEWHTHCAVCCMPYTRKNGLLTPSQRAEIQHQFERLLKQYRICHTLLFFSTRFPILFRWVMTPSSIFNECCHCHCHCQAINIHFANIPRKPL